MIRAFISGNFLCHLQTDASPNRMNMGSVCVCVCGGPPTVFVMPLTPDLILATQKWNNNLARICALMTACSVKPTMTASMLSSLSETADSRQST